MTAPAAKGFDGCGVRAGVVPRRRARAFAVEASGERAGDEDDARATFPAAGTLLEFTRGRILGATGFAVSPMAAVEVQRHARILAPLPDITRTERAIPGESMFLLMFLMWRRGWDSNPRAGYPTRRFRGAPVTTTSVPLRLVGPSVQWTSDYTTHLNANRAARRPAARGPTPRRGSPSARPQIAAAMSRAPSPRPEPQSMRANV